METFCEPDDMNLALSIVSAHEAVGQLESEGNSNLLIKVRDFWILYEDQVIHISWMCSFCHFVVGNINSKLFHVIDDLCHGMVTSSKFKDQELCTSTTSGHYVQVFFFDDMIKPFILGDRFRNLEYQWAPIHKNRVIYNHYITT